MSFSLFDHVWLTSFKDCVGSDGRPGYGQIRALAKYLVSLKDITALSNEQVEYIEELFQHLHQTDKGRIKYAPRFKQQLNHGRFCMSKSTVVPGVDSVKRYLFFDSNELLVNNINVYAKKCIYWMGGSQNLLIFILCFNARYSFKDLII